MDVFELNAPTAIINYEGFVPQTATRLRQPQSVDSNIHLMAFDDSSAGQFFSSDDPCACFRGGARTYYGPGPIPSSMNFTIQLNDSGYAPNTFYAQASTTPSEMDAIFVWPSNLFAAAYQGRAIRFGTTPDTCSFRMNLTGAGPDGTELRFLVREGEQYYISEQAFSAAGIWVLTNFQGNAAAGQRWALFDPAATPFPPATTGLVFQAVTFQDVTAVGLFYRGRRNMYLQEFTFNVFTVKAALPEPCAALVPLALLCWRCKRRVFRTTPRTVA